MDSLTLLEGSAFCAGLGMGTASILSIGPNNLTLIREGLIRGRIVLVASLIWSSYLVLILLALILGDRIAAGAAALRPALSWFGLVALCWFACVYLRAFFLAPRRFRATVVERERTGDCIRRILVIVWCNPLTYIETLLIPAAVMCSFIMPVCRVLFGAGLMLMTTVACYGYPYGGGLLSPYLRRENTLRVFDLGSGVVFSVMAVLMAIGLMLRPG